MKRLIIASFLFCIIGMTSLSAQTLRGIYIESNTPVEVYMNQQKVCNPVQSCMITNLARGNYFIEAFEASSQSMNGKPNLLYRETIYYTGRGVEEIIVESDNQDEFFGYRQAMDKETFDRFLKSFKDATFDSDKEAVLNMVLPNALFLTTQVEKIVNLYTFDSEKVKAIKKLYPNIIDKERAFVLLDLLDFSSSKDDISRFMAKF